MARTNLIGACLTVFSVLATAGIASAAAERRVALVIGNAGYEYAPALANPARDARAVTAALEQVGFSAATLHLDLGRAAMMRALQGFAREARAADVALVFYAGHGMELGGRNYLIPKDAKLATDQDVAFEAIPLELVQGAVEGAKRLRLVILDACRDNPFAVDMVMTSGGARGIGRGLARIEPSADTLVAYAAKDGNVAQDGFGAHSPFTAALLQHLGTPGLEIQFLFRKVRDAVRAATGDRQEPFVYGSLGGEPYYLVPPVEPAPAGNGSAEVAFWRSVEDSDEVEDFAAYLGRFPGGVFAGLARNRVKALTASAVLAARETSAPLEGRCAGILQKAQLGETLADDERIRLRTNCRQLGR